MSSLRQVARTYKYRTPWAFLTRSGRGVSRIVVSPYYFSIRLITLARARKQWYAQFAYCFPPFFCLCEVGSTGLLDAWNLNTVLTTYQSLVFLQRRFQKNFSGSQPNCKEEYFSLVETSFRNGWLWIYKCRYLHVALTNDTLKFITEVFLAVCEHFCVVAVLKRVCW